MHFHQSLVRKTFQALTQRRSPSDHSYHHAPQTCMFLMGGGALATSQVVANIIAKAVEAARERQQAPGPLKVLLIPTAKVTLDTYNESLRLTHHIYIRYHASTLTVLHEFGKAPDPTAARLLLAQADLIHMPGGSTQYALNFWKKNNLLEPIISAVNRGAVVFGHSAGQIIWFEHCLTDSDHYLLSPGIPWKYKMLKGIGEFRCLISPHASDYALQFTHDHVDYQPGMKLRDVFLESIYATKRNGLAVDGNTAIHSLGQTACVLGSGEVTLYKWNHGITKLKIQSLHAGQEFYWSTLEN